MTQMLNLWLGPLGTALLPYASRRSVGGVLKGGTLELDLESPSDPAVILAGIMDFGGSVRLAECLPACKAPPEGMAAGDGQLAVRVRDRVGVLRKRVVAILNDAGNANARIPGPEQTWEVLNTHSAWSGAANALSASAADLWAPLSELIFGRIEHIRAAMGELRDDIGLDLRAIGGGAARLEKLDAVLTGATRIGVDKLLARLAPAMESAFRDDLARAVKGTCAKCSDDLKPWFCADGWFVRHWRQGKGVILGLVDWEADRLFALAEAHCRTIDS